MRKSLAATLLVIALVVAGCGGGSSSNNTTTTGSSGNGEASKPAQQVLTDAVKAANAASSFHMSAQQVMSGGQQIRSDVTIVKGKGATLSMTTLGGQKIELVVIGKKGYIRGSAALWAQVAFPAMGSLAKLLHGKWGAFPANAAVFRSLLGLADSKTLFDQISSQAGTLTNKGLTTYKGQSVVAIGVSAKGMTLYVAATGTPYPVGMVRTGSTNSGSASFDRWGQSVTLTAPSGAIDVSKLGG